MGRLPLSKRLTKEQIDYLMTAYPYIPNREMAEVLHLHHDSISKYANRHGLTKSAEYISSVRRGAGKKAAHTNLYKDGHPAYVLTREQEERRRRHMTETMRELVRKERLRMEYGLPRLTRWHLSSSPKWLPGLRFRLKEKGYILDEEKRTAYYDENTNRSPLLERRKRWYTFDMVDKRPEFVNHGNQEDSEDSETTY